VKKHVNLKILKNFKIIDYTIFFCYIMKKAILFKK